MNRSETEALAPAAVAGRGCGQIRAYTWAVGGFSGGPIGVPSEPASLMAVTDSHVAFVQSVTTGRFSKRTEAQVFAVIPIAHMAEVRVAPEGDGWPKRLLVDLADGGNLAVTDSLHHPGWDGVIDFLASRLQPAEDVTSASGWNQLRQHVKSRFTVANEGNDYLAVNFGIGSGGRSQMAVVSCVNLMDGAEEWAVIQSAVGRRAQLDPLVVVRAAEGLIVGGLALGLDMVMVRHTMVLTTFDEAEFDDAIVQVALAADGLEERLLGSDEF